MERLSPARAPWLGAPESRQVMDALDAAQPDSSRFVGGCVRNAVMGRRADDLDIATQLLPEAVMGALAAANIKAVPTGLAHGTVTAVAEGKPFEITTLRRDVDTDGRHATVAFGASWEEDAARRDFRLNALYAARDGTLFDPVGGGVADALAGRVVFVGQPEQRIREDYLRILRFFRFNAWYGAEIDRPGLSACAALKGGLGALPAEREWKELEKTLRAPAPAEALEAMEASRVLGEVLPGSSAAPLSALQALEAQHAVAPSAVRRLAALLKDGGPAPQDAAAMLRLSNKEGAALTAALDPGLAGAASLSGDALRRAFYEHGVQAVLDRAMLEGADQGTPTNWELPASAERYERPTFPLGGADALAAGLEGPEIGRALAAAEAHWAASGFTSDRAELLAGLRRAGHAEPEERGEPGE